MRRGFGGATVCNVEAESTVRVQRASVELLRRHEAMGTEVGTLIAGVSAQCPSLDDAALASLGAGWRSPANRVAPTLHGDLLASSTGLFYVVPQARYVWFRPWSQVELAAGKVPRLGFRRAQLIAFADHEPFVFFVAARAVDTMLRAASDRGGRAAGTSAR